METSTRTTLRTTTTQCTFCARKTAETVRADQMIKSLPENEVFGGRLKIVECSECGLRYLNPMPDLRDLHHIYNYDVYEDSTNNNPVLMEHFHATLAEKCARLNKVLEIGCGTGDFLAYLEEKGIAATGVEFADSANRKKFKGQMLYGRMEDIDIPDASFDAVLLLNVIEHLAEPMAVLHKIRRMLPPGGALLLRHPNSDLFFNPFYRALVESPKYLWHKMQKSRGKRTGFTVLGFQNQHLFYFNKRSVVAMLHEAGFDIARFSTVDPYNRLRIRKALKGGNVIESAIATIRHALGFVGLGPECLTVAIASNKPVKH
ncbi:MAG TPA: class I SAM-dependent methyltransferase [Vicinamibacterales bacterium]|jgi:SAM-dependent methyltransferase